MKLGGVHRELILEEGLEGCVEGVNMTEIQCINTWNSEKNKSKIFKERLCRL